MLIFVNQLSENPYSNSTEYSEKSRSKNFVHEGITFDEAIVYEKKLSVIYRIALATISCLAMLTILPYYFYSEKVNLLWKQARHGIDLKIVFVRTIANVGPSQAANLNSASESDQPKVNGGKKQVHFGVPRARAFDKDEAPSAVGEQTSFIFQKKAADKSISPMIMTDTPGLRSLLNSLSSSSIH